MNVIAGFVITSDLIIADVRRNTQTAAKIMRSWNGSIVPGGDSMNLFIIIGLIFTGIFSLPLLLFSLILSISEALHLRIDDPKRKEPSKDDWKIMQ